MQSTLVEITKVRNGAAIAVDYHNSNRYRLVALERDGSKTAYYFGTPIYNITDRKLIDGKFLHNGREIYSIGSSANITISEKILMKSKEGTCTIELTEKPILTSHWEVRCGGTTLIPTTNGVAMKYNIRNGEKISCVIEVDKPSLTVRANDKCFALMKEKFRPFVVFSCVGSLDANGNVIAPAKIEYQKLTDTKYRLTLSAANPQARYVLFEGNLYENKLFQDTTVESMSPLANNAFGGMGFIGNTSLYGEQWLYSRLDCSKMPEMMDKYIRKAVLYIPKLNQKKIELSAFKVAARFCSFGSNWNNKIAASAPVADSSSISDYYSLDMESLLVDPRTKTITKTEGMILKSRVKGSGFSAIATGDSCYAPQILEINFR